MGRAVTETAYFIRAGDRHDVPGVDALLQKSYPRLLKADYPPSTLVLAIPLISQAQPDLVACGTYYVAETLERQIVGCGGWTLRNPASGRDEGFRGSIRHFATDPDLLRQGVATALMARCLRDAREAGMVGMDCYSTRTAVPFYLSQGFEPLREIEMELRPGITFPAVAMRLDL